MVHGENMRKEFALRLAQACKQKGLDDHGRGMAIARALNVTSKGVSKWLNAESLPRQEKMNALAKFLGVNVVWLQHGDGEDGYDNKKRHDLSKREEILLELFGELPESEADALLKALEEKKRHYDELYKELSAKRHNKAS